VRNLVLLGCAALLLSGCGGKNQTVENTDTATQTLTEETPPAGDTTAIDAATGADANMAADAEIPTNDIDTNAVNNSTGNSD
jgi:PBP1b-binding outer membrane lipoprotein LpoB